MGNKDKIMLVLAFISILFVGFITIKNYPKEEKILSGSTFYTSDETTTLGKREGSSYATLNNIGRVECPGLDNRIPQGKLITTTGTTAYANAYGFSYLPYTEDTLNLGVTKINSSNLSHYIQDNIDSTLNVLFSGASPSIAGSYYEIVVPFSYTITTSNLDVSGSNDIILVNAAGNCKMVISNPANWFCAGVYGTTTKYSNTEPEVSWIDHGNHHISRVGNGSSGYESGSAGDLIAYGGEDTIVKFYATNGGSWSQQSIFNICRTSLANEYK